jgi:hypothetical protein
MNQSYEEQTPKKKNQATTYVPSLNHSIKYKSKQHLELIT